MGFNSAFKGLINTIVLLWMST